MGPKGPVNKGLGPASWPLGPYSCGGSAPGAPVPTLHDVPKDLGVGLSQLLGNSLRLFPVPRHVVEARVGGIRGGKAPPHDQAEGRSRAFRPILFKFYTISANFKLIYYKKLEKI